MSIFDWSLPAGCGVLPGEEPIAPCCEECPEEEYENCPCVCETPAHEDDCLRFLKSLRRETFYTVVELQPIEEN